MTANYDVIVVGLGAMGSAALSQLSERGLKVLGIDQFDPPHNLGSSHGATRVIREAYFEDPSYVPLLKRSYDLWHQLEEKSGERLFLQTGGLMMGRANSTIVGGAKESADTHNLPYEWLNADQIRDQYPQFKISDETVAVWEPRAGILFPEKCISLFLQDAKTSGAQIQTQEEVLEWKNLGGSYHVKTSKGTHQAEQLILSTGPWIASLLPEFTNLFEVDRQLLFWFEPGQNTDQFKADQLPIFIWEYDLDKYIYGFPDLGEGFKVAKHYSGTRTDPASIDREVHPHEINEMNSILHKHIPAATGTYRSSAVCMYTNTPDLHFLIDEHPEHSGLWIVSPCSGHGFKFACLIGELLADFVLGNRTEFDLSLFKLGRFINDR